MWRIPDNNNIWEYDKNSMVFHTVDGTQVFQETVITSDVERIIYISLNNNSPRGTPVCTKDFLLPHNEKRGMVWLRWWQSQINSSHILISSFENTLYFYHSCDLPCSCSINVIHSRGITFPDFIMPTFRLIFLLSFQSFQSSPMRSREMRKWVCCSAVPKEDYEPMQRVVNLITWNGSSLWFIWGKVGRDRNTRNFIMR